jgi:hypothetical protein
MDERDLMRLADDGNPHHDDGPPPHDPRAYDGPDLATNELVVTVREPGPPNRSEEPGECISS